MYTDPSLSPPRPPRPPSRTATLPLPPEGEGGGLFFVGWFRANGLGWVRSCAADTEAVCWERLRTRVKTLNLPNADLTVTRLGDNPNTTRRTRR